MSSTESDAAKVMVSRKRKSEEDKDEDHDSCNSKKSKSDSDNLAENVHTFNKWEKAELGDEDRKAKFLRLMGGAKAKPRPAEEASSKDKPSSDDHSAVSFSLSGVDDIERVEKIDKDLESQFVHSLADKLSSRSRRHCGLGFQETPLAATPGSEALGHLTTGFVKAESQVSLASVQNETSGNGSEDVHNAPLPAANVPPCPNYDKQEQACHDASTDKHMHFVSEGGRKHVDL